MKPFSEIFKGDIKAPWTQDLTNDLFFWVELNRPWNPKQDIYYERNPHTQKFQALKFDPDFLGKRDRAELPEEDAIGISRDGLKLWRLSSDSKAVLSIDDMAYDSVQNGYQSADGEFYTSREGEVLIGAT
jgi:hypothetical protein